MNALAPLNVSEQTYELVRILNGEDPGLMFNPRTDVKSQLSDLFDMRFEDDFDLGAQRSIAKWREAKHAAYLYQAGVSYLIFDSSWYGWLSDEEFARISDPEQYTLIFPNEADIGNTSLYVYRVQARVLPDDNS